MLTVYTEYVFICKVCGREFERVAGRGRFPHYCSTECKTGGRKTDLVRACDICGKEFVANLKGNPRRCCSVACKNEKENRRQRNSRLHEKVCVVCGVEFVTARKASVACSPECQYQRTLDYSKQRHLVYMATRPETKEIICKWCETPVIVPAGLSGGRKFHEECKAQATRAKNRKKNVKRQGAKTQELIVHEVIAKRDNYVCHLCGELVDMSLPRRSHYGATLDHVIPIAKGGLDSEDNVKLAHWICNVRKSDKLEIDNG